MKPYGIRSPVKFPGKLQHNIKLHGIKLKSWWEVIVEPNKQKLKREALKEIEEELNE